MAVLLVAVILLASPSPRPSVQQVVCPETFCASLTLTISVGGASAAQLGYVTMSLVQYVAAALALSQLLAGLGMVRRKVPRAFLGASRRLRGVDAEGDRASDLGMGDIPIESASGGKITSTMRNSPNLFGLGGL